jgi:glutaredoxin-related protein
MANHLITWAKDDSLELKMALSRLTKHSTFPNILVNGKSIGGSDTLEHLHKEGSLKAIFEAAGVSVIEYAQ